MTKSICALVHKAGSSREAFQRYYEDNHAPLAIGLFPFSGYARNHLTDAADFEWDTISEFWAEDIGQAAALMAGPIGETMRADEERFMDRARIAAAGVEEIILSGGERADLTGKRTALLVNWVEGDGDARMTTLALAGALAREHMGVSVDFTVSWGTPAFPATALIWMPGWHAAIDGPTGLSLRTLRMVRAETPPSSLLGVHTADC